MHGNRRRALEVLVAAALLGLLVLTLVPARYLPPNWTPFVRGHGQFEGRAVHVTAPNLPRPAFPVSGQVRMEAGTCQVAYIEPGGETRTHFTIGDGTFSLDMVPGGAIRLDPGSGRGRYEVFIGPAFHPLSPKGRVVVWVALGGTVVAWFAWRARRRAQARAPSAGRIAFLLLLAIVCATIIYPVVHEFGHAAVGTVLGGRVDRVTWTVLSGEHPHVLFSHLSQAAWPWMSAGGILVPTLVGVVLLSVWLALAGRLSWYASAAMLLPGVTLLMGNVACILAVFSGEPSHMGAISTYYRLMTIEPYLVELSPPAVTLFMYVLVIRRWRQISRAGEAARVASASSTPSGG